MSDYWGFIAGTTQITFLLQVFCFWGFLTKSLLLSFVAGTMANEILWTKSWRKINQKSSVWWSVLILIFNILYIYIYIYINQVVYHSRGWPESSFFSSSYTMVQGGWYLILWIVPLYPWSLSKVASSTIFWVFGMSWPGIDPPVFQTVSELSTD